jgi:hypothetical protein
MMVARLVHYAHELPLKGTTLMTDSCVLPGGRVTMFSKLACVLNRTDYRHTSFHCCHNLLTIPAHTLNNLS